MNDTKSRRPKNAKRSNGLPFESSDEEEFNEPEIFEQKRNYEELIRREDFINANTIVRMDANEFNMDYVRKTGLSNPIVFTGQMDVLGIKIPNFTYRDVLDRIPESQKIDMFNHHKEKQQILPVSKIVDELEKPADVARDGPLNMLSLECSSMEMSKHIEPPRLVRELDWAQRVFPKEKFSHRKYILMTMGGSYTEFHVDFGGTSVWYHVQTGEKYFFLIEPSDNNFRIFEEWLNAYRAGTNTGFFGDVVQQCAVVRMLPGQTLILPAGWIHSVYTPHDSLVFGGNFLHEYSISMQLRVRDYENRSQIRKKFTYPFYEQTLWYFAAHFVKEATDRNYIRLIHSEDYQKELMKSPKDQINDCYDVRVEPEEFYDQHTNDPKQQRFDPVDERLNDSPPKFNDEFLRTLKKSLRYDLYKVKSFLQSEYEKRNTRGGRVAEGIRRPNHLLRDFERVIDRIMNWNENEFHDKSQTFIKSTSEDYSLEINTSGDDKDIQSTISPSSSVDSTNKNGTQPSIVEKKAPRKRSIPKDPSSRQTTTKPVLKHRKEENLPMPSASSNPSSADDPVLSAVPLGKSNTRTSFKKINLAVPKKTSATTFSRVNKPQISPSQSISFNSRQNLPTTSVTFDQSIQNPSDPGTNYAIDYQESEFYSSTSIPCDPTISLYSAPLRQEPKPTSTFEYPPNTNTYVESFAGNGLFPTNHSNKKVEVIQKVPPSIQLFDKLLENVESCADDDF